MVTQKDIALKTGLSVSLVSRALSGTAEAIGVPPQTVEKVRRAAAAMRYQPNASARILKGAAARTFGVVVYDFEDPFFGPIVGELQRLAHQQGFSLVLGGFERRRVWDLDVNGLLKHHIDGLLIIGSGHDLGWAQPFADQGMPMVRVGSGPRLRGLHSVEVDERQGVALLVQHLAAQGCRRIGFVGAEQPTHVLRLKYFKAALRTMGVRASTRHIVMRPERLAAAGYEAARQLITGPGVDALDAVVAASDLVALGALRGLAESSCQVPAHLRLCGYDDIPGARLSVPSLTTVRQPVEEMARTAFERIVHSDGEAPKTVFSPELIVRESTR